jgi:hypothetical protein
VPGLWKSPGDGRVRTADQQAGPGVMSSHPTAQSSKPRSAIYSRSVSRKRGALSPRVKGLPRRG